MNHTPQADRPRVGGVGRGDVAGGALASRPPVLADLTERLLADLRAVGELVPMIGGSFSTRIEFLGAVETMADYVPELGDAIEAAVNGAGCTTEQASEAVRALALYVKVAEFSGQL
jgi:hypothetical protein